jgi:hypothetical protein
MGKKLQWIYLGIYCAAMLYLFISVGLSSGTIVDSILPIAMFLFPAALVAFELSGKKVPVIITLVALLFVGIMFVGILKFNTMTWDVVFKAVLFAIMLILLAWYAYKRLFKK